MVMKLHCRDIESSSCSAVPSLKAYRTVIPSEGAIQQHRVALHTISRYIYSTLGLCHSRTIGSKLGDDSTHLFKYILARPSL
jgi:hypothetical protein